MKKAINTLRIGIITAAFFTITAIVLITPIIVLCVVK